LDFSEIIGYIPIIQRNRLIFTGKNAAEQSQFDKLSLLEEEI